MGETVLEFFLQASVLVFTVTHHEDGEQIITLADRKAELVSLSSKVLTLSLGLSTVWLSKFEKDLSPLRKIIKLIKLINCNLYDVLMRMVTILCIIMLGFRWRFGLAIMMAVISGILLFSPLLFGAGFFICTKQKSFIQLDRTLLLVPMFWHTLDTSANGTVKITGSHKQILQKSRVLNKLCGIVMSCLSLLIVALALKEKLLLPQFDPW